MAETVAKLPIKQEKSAAPTSTELWQPFETLRGEIDRMFDDFGRGFWPSWGRSLRRAAPEWQRNNATRSNEHAPVHPNLWL